MVNGILARQAWHAALRPFDGSAAEPPAQRRWRKGTKLEPGGSSGSLSGTLLDARHQVPRQFELPRIEEDRWHASTIDYRVDGARDEDVVRRRRVLALH